MRLICDNFSGNNIGFLLQSVHLFGHPDAKIKNNNFGQKIQIHYIASERFIMKGSMKRPVKQISTLAVVVIQLAIGSLAFAQFDEEKNFLSMYFTDEELVVQSATRSPKPVSQVAENITVVTAADIELMNAHTVADVLNTVPGVVVWQAGGPGQMGQPYIQGSEARHVTVIIDGVVLNNIGNNTADVGMLPVQNIEKIEIIKGPASSVWGSALGGVVNIITKTGGKSTEHGVHSDAVNGMLSASYGTKNTGDFRAETGGKQEKFSYYVTAGRLESDGLTPHFDLAENNGYVKATYDLTSNTNILFAVGYEKTARGMGNDTVWDMSQKNMMEIIHSTVAVSSALTKDLEINLSLRTLRVTFEQNYYQLSTGALLQEYKDKDKGYGSSGKLTWKGAAQTIVAGADYDDKTLTSNQITDGEQGITKWALYANDTITLNRFSLTPGLRYDHTSTNGEMTSPSLGLTYSLANDTIFRASAAKGFSIPTLGETFGDSTYYTPNPDLKMETVWSYQAGAETAAAKYVWMKLSAFRNDIRDAITSESTGPDPYPVTRVNKGRQRRQGVEFAVKTTPVYNTSLSAGAEYIDAQDLETGDKVKDIPSNVYDIGLRYDDERSFKALLQGRYINWNADPIWNGKYGSFIFDLTAAKKIYSRQASSLEAVASVHNILNDDQYFTELYKNPGRWFEAGIKYKF
jgi:vitamin B12 transporter